MKASIERGESLAMTRGNARRRAIGPIEMENRLHSALHAIRAECAMDAVTTIGSLLAVLHNSGYFVKAQAVG